MTVTPATAQHEPQTISPNDGEIAIFEASGPDDGIREIFIRTFNADILVNVQGLHANGEFARVSEGVETDGGTSFTSGYRDIRRVIVKAPDKRSLFDPSPTTAYPPRVIWHASAR